MKDAATVKFAIPSVSSIRHNGLVVTFEPVLPELELIVTESVSPAVIRTVVPPTQVSGARDGDRNLSPR